jgi:ATP-dependent helicase Lhr and Lhr-like helicase
VSNFEELHPAIQHHIVNSLGWRELRPFQEAVIPRILAGEHLVILAPTAGGKTEAAFLPVLSRMLAEDWQGLSVLYLCPIKALLNNLEFRLARYCGLVGRRAALWHSDVGAGARKRIQREPPDCVLTTPESLEVMLVSPNVDSRNLLGNVRAVIVDEIHAFAGDDRGWHVLSVLERVTHLAGREIQRIGLSATVGNPEVLAGWLAGSATGATGVALPPPSEKRAADVTIDYVGSLSNAAVVISRVGRGEKRLVFVDSRSRAEQLGNELRQLDTTTFVTHSSLSADQRRQAEDAFANRDDCVIVATSVLELGIDVGDLDRVIQIDAPTTVSSFLQRMGRTGRRAGAIMNCLFLATDGEALLKAAAIVSLWELGYVEPIEPPRRPMHIMAQQIMALALQERGIGRSDWFQWIAGVEGFQKTSDAERAALVAWMLAEDILFDDSGILWFGKKGETKYGHKNFLEIMSVFLSPPVISVLHGRQELGYVDEMTFLGKTKGPKVLLLGGRAWRVTHIDWQRRVAFVEATEDKGRSRWKGDARPLSFRVTQSIKSLLASDERGPVWSNRGGQEIELLRAGFPWIELERTTLVRSSDSSLKWWTFGGFRANLTLIPKLAELAQCPIRVDNFALRFDDGARLEDAEQAIRALRNLDAQTLSPSIDESALIGLKFSACLPVDSGTQMLAARLADTVGARHVLKQDFATVTEG